MRGVSMRIQLKSGCIERRKKERNRKKESNRNKSYVSVF